MSITKRTAYISNNYKTICVKYTNLQGQVVGYDSLLVPKDTKDYTGYLNFSLKKWNKTHCKGLIADKFEVMDKSKSEKPKPQYTQLTLF